MKIRAAIGIFAVAAALTACTTLPSAVSCTNAPKVRAAAALALQALERACPMDLAQ